MSSYYKLGATAFPKQSAGLIRVYHNGVVPDPVVGLVGGGYFQTELHSLDDEVEQTASVLDQAVGRRTPSEVLLNPSGGFFTKGTPEQVAWYRSVWSSFYEGWKRFFRDYTTGWKSIRFPISTSRVEQIEDYRKQFIQLRGLVERMFAGDPVVANLPVPTAPKTYTNWWDDLTSGIKSVIIMALVGLAGVVLIFVLGSRFGGPASMAAIRA
jgi:hypothetical protein